MYAGIERSKMSVSEVILDERARSFLVKDQPRKPETIRDAPAVQASLHIGWDIAIVPILNYGARNEPAWPGDDVSIYVLDESLYVTRPEFIVGGAVAIGSCFIRLVTHV